MALAATVNVNVNSSRAAHRDAETHPEKSTRARSPCCSSLLSTASSSPTSLNTQIRFRACLLPCLPLLPRHPQVAVWLGMAWSRGRVPLGRCHRPHDQECLFFSKPWVFFAITHSFLSFLILIMQRCRGPHQRAQVILAQWHLPPLDLCL